MYNPLTLKTFGLGRDTTKNPSHLLPGQARDSLNLYHGFPEEAKARQPIDRVWHTRPNGAVPTLGAWDLVKTDLSVVHLTKIGSKLYSFLIDGTSTTELKTGLDATHLPDFANANGRGFIADWQDKNYSTDGTAAGTNELQKTYPTGVFTAASGGTATGNTATTIEYWYSDVNAYDGAESPPSLPVSVNRSADAGATLSNSSLSFSTPWTTKNLYRTRAGSDQPYLVTTGLTAGSFPYTDTSLDTSLTTASTIHDDSGSASIEKPEAAKHTCFHRGRLFLANLVGHPSRIRWSRPIEPTQFELSTSARRDIGKNDGGEITGMVSFRGSLVIFKTNSIWIMNGDDDELNFTFFPAATGIGCVAPRTIRKDGDRRILFLSACGVYSYDLSQAIRVSDSIHDDVCCLNYASRKDFFCAGVDPCERAYLLSVSPAGVSTNTKTHMLNLDSGSWGRVEFGMNVIVPSCYSDTADVGPIKNSTGSIKLYVGDESGYLYETDSSSAVGDGVTSGTVAATVTATNITREYWVNPSNNSDIGGGYKTLEIVDPAVANNSISSVGIPDGGLIMAFVTDPAALQFSTFSAGTYTLTSWWRQTAGTKIGSVDAYLYERTSGGTETLFLSFATSDNFTGSVAQYAQIGTLSAARVFASGSRLVLKFCVNTTGAGTETNLELNYGVSYPSRLTLDENETTTTASAAAFRTTGDALKGVPMTVRRAADNSYETVTITSNTATVITHPALSGAAIAVGDTIYIGAYQATLSMGRLGGQTAGMKRWKRMAATHQKEAAATYPLRMGYTLDGDTAPTSTDEVDMSLGFRSSRPVNRRAIGLSPYFDIIGPRLSFELILLEFDIEAFERRLPTR